jgi:hypothetical protein
MITILFGLALEVRTLFCRTISSCNCVTMTVINTIDTSESGGENTWIWCIILYTNKINLNFVCFYTEKYVFFIIRVSSVL